MTAPAINLDQARTACRRRAYQPVDRTPAENEDRERRKRLWLDRIDADLPSPEGRAAAGEFHVSLRLARQLSGLIVNLDSFLDRGFVYASQAGLADRIKNANEERMSDRQVRRGVAFLEARGHLRVERTRGTRNQMYPLYRGAAAAPGATITDTMSSDPGRHVLPFEAPCPPKQASKLLDQSQKEPPLPPVEPIADKGGDDQRALEGSKQSGLPRKDALDGEVLGPENEITFWEFWEASGRIGKWGPASSQWDKLSPDDRRAIGALCREHGINTGGSWAAKWLQKRCWKDPTLCLDRNALASEKLGALAGDIGEFSYSRPRTKLVFAVPGSAIWLAERARLVAFGDHNSVRFMDDKAKNSESWQCEVSV